MFAPELLVQAEGILGILRARKQKLATAESCTGGLLSALFTAIPGSSDVFERGFVTYSNAAKAELLGIPLSMIEYHGAVSEETVRAMAEGALRNSRADVAVSITGVAGPGGGSPGKPVGLVYIGVAEKNGGVKTARFYFADEPRDRVRSNSIKAALNLIIS